MPSPQIHFNPDERENGGRFEAHCPDGFIDTVFVFPPELKQDDDPPDLWMSDVPGALEPFHVLGQYEISTDSLQLVICGQVGFFYKMSVQQMAAGSEQYVWKIKKKGEINPSAQKEDILHVPLSICKGGGPARLEQVNGPKEVVSFQTSNDHQVPDHFCRLRLKVRIKRGSFATPPVHMKGTTANAIEAGDGQLMMPAMPLGSSGGGGKNYALDNVPGQGAELFAKTGGISLRVVDEKDPVMTEMNQRNDATSDAWIQNNYYSDMSLERLDGLTKFLDGSESSEVTRPEVDSSSSCDPNDAEALMAAMWFTAREKVMIPATNEQKQLAGDSKFCAVGSSSQKVTPSKAWVPKEDGKMRPPYPLSPKITYKHGLEDADNCIPDSFTNGRNGEKERQTTVALLERDTSTHTSGTMSSEASDEDWEVPNGNLKNGQIEQTKDGNKWYRKLSIRMAKGLKRHQKKSD